MLDSVRCPSTLWNPCGPTPWCDSEPMRFLPVRRSAKSGFENPSAAAADETAGDIARASGGSHHPGGIAQPGLAEQSFGDFDQALNIAVGKLRSALGDSAENPRFIETLPKRGYRFIATSRLSTRTSAQESRNLLLEIRLLWNLKQNPVTWSKSPGCRLYPNAVCGRCVESSSWPSSWVC